MRRRIGSLLLALVLVLTSSVLTVFAAQPDRTYTYEEDKPVPATNAYQVKIIVDESVTGTKARKRPRDIFVENEDNIIYARPYYTVEMDGELVTIYGDVYKDNYIGKIEINDGVLEW